MGSNLGRGGADGAACIFGAAATGAGAFAIGAGVFWIAGGGGGKVGAGCGSGLLCGVVTDR